MVNDQFQLCFLYFAILIVLHFHVANSKITHHLFENIRPNEHRHLAKFCFTNHLRDMVEHVGGVLVLVLFLCQCVCLFMPEYTDSCTTMLKDLPTLLSCT